MYSMFVPPTIETVLRIMTAGSSPDYSDPIAEEAYNKEISEMSNSIAGTILENASVLNRKVADLTNSAVKPISAAVTTVVTATSKNLLPIYKSAFFLLSQLIIDEMLVQQLGNQATRMTIEVTAYVVTEQWWHETGGSGISNIDLHLLEKVS